MVSFERFINQAISPWMKEEGPDSDIVLSSRIRLARNLENFPFSIMTTEQDAYEILQYIQKQLKEQAEDLFGSFEWVFINNLKPVEKLVLIEKHLISPQLANESLYGAVLLNDLESISIMINEEDHIRIQCLYPGFQIDRALSLANEVDDFLESNLDYAYDEKRGYLTSCPTNVGTGLRASVMMHLPALTLTRRLNRIIPAINQLGLVVRGIYGEGSEALGNIFQISNQMTLGKSEKDIVSDLAGVVRQLIEQEREARSQILEVSKIQLEDKVFRSYGVLSNSRIIQSKEAASCLSDVRLGIDLGLIQGLSRNILNELMVLTQPGFLQQYAGRSLDPGERDIRRATLIRERLKLE